MPRKKEWRVRIRYKDKRTGQWRKPVLWTVLSASEYDLVLRRFVKRYRKEVMTRLDHYAMRELHIELDVTRGAIAVARCAAAAKSLQTSEAPSPMPLQS